MKITVLKTENFVDEIRHGGRGLVYEIFECQITTGFWRWKNTVKTSFCWDSGWYYWPGGRNVKTDMSLILYDAKKAHEWARVEKRREREPLQALAETELE